MYRTCTVQIEPRLLLRSRHGEEAARRRSRCSRSATALFANSPFTEGKPNGFVSFRSEIWRDTDNERAGMLPWVFEPGMGFERYADYALDVPMYFIKRGDSYIDVSGQVVPRSSGRQAASPGERATISDWANHVSTIFPEVRLKRYIEMRGSDGGPWRRLPSLPAFWVGLIYDDDNLDACWEIVKDWTAEERQKLRDDVPRLGFKATIRGQSLLDIAMELLRAGRAGAGAPQAGLTATAATRRAYLRPLQEIARAASRRRKSCWRNSTAPWNGSVEPIFDEYAY